MQGMNDSVSRVNTITLVLTLTHCKIITKKTNKGGSMHQLNIMWVTTVFLMFFARLLVLLVHVDFFFSVYVLCYLPFPTWQHSLKLIVTIGNFLFFSFGFCLPCSTDRHFFFIKITHVPSLYIILSSGILSFHFCMWDYPFLPSLTVFILFWLSFVPVNSFFNFMLSVTSNFFLSKLVHQAHQVHLPPGCPSVAHYLNFFTRLFDQIIIQNHEGISCSFMSPVAFFTVIRFCLSLLPTLFCIFLLQFLLPVHLPDWNLLVVLYILTKIQNDHYE